MQYPKLTLWFSWSKQTHVVTLQKSLLEFAPQKRGAEQVLEKWGAVNWKPGLIASCYCLIEAKRFIIRQPRTTTDRSVILAHGPKSGLASTVWYARRTNFNKTQWVRRLLGAADEFDTFLDAAEKNGNYTVRPAQGLLSSRIKVKLINGTHVEDFDDVEDVLELAALSNDLKLQYESQRPSHFENVPQDLSVPPWFLQHLPDALHKPFDIVVLQKTHCMPVAQPINRLYTIFFEPSDNGSGCVKVQVMQFSDEASGEIEIQNLAIGNEGKTLIPSWYFMCDRHGSVIDSANVTDKRTWRFVIARNQAPMLVILAGYGAPLFECHNDSLIDWITVEVAAYTSQRNEGIEYAFAVARQGFDVEFAVAADFAPFTKRQPVSRPMHEWDRGLLACAASVSTAAADCFSPSNGRKAFKALGDGNLESYAWATDYSSSQIRNTAYVVRGRNSLIVNSD